MKDSKDYRYYSLAQYDFFGVIELLKAVGNVLKGYSAVYGREIT